MPCSLPHITTPPGSVCTLCDIGFTTGCARVRHGVFPQVTFDADIADSDDFLADIMHTQSTHKSQHVCWAKSVDSFMASFRNASDNTVQKGKFRVRALTKKLVPNWHAEVKFQRHRAVHFAATGATLPQQALESEFETPPAKRLRQREDTQRRA